MKTKQISAIFLVIILLLSLSFVIAENHEDPEGPENPENNETSESEPQNYGQCVKEATQAALECADANDLKRIAIPGMGTGVGRVPKDKAAQAMVSVIKSFEAHSLEEVILIDRGDEMVKEFGKALKSI